MNRHFTKALMPVKTISTVPGPLEGVVRFHDQKHPCIHSFRWKTVSAFAVNFDSINNKNSTFIELGACTANVCQL
jgi:hypothetical protein